jgi:hypothetical protein
MPRLAAATTSAAAYIPWAGSQDCAFRAALEALQWSIRMTPGQTSRAPTAALVRQNCERRAKNCAGPAKPVHEKTGHDMEAGRRREHWQAHVFVIMPAAPGLLTYAQCARPAHGRRRQLGHSTLAARGRLTCAALRQGAVAKLKLKESCCLRRVSPRFERSSMIGEVRARKGIE